VETAERRDRTLLAAALTSAGAVFLAFAWPLLQGRVYLGGDLGSYTLIARDFLRGCLERGDSFLWWPNLAGGVYLHGLGQLGLFHPLRTATYWALPLPWSFALELLPTYPFALAGMFWLLRRWGLSRPAACFGGSLFAFSGFSLLHHVHTNVVAVAAHIPWLLAAIDVLVRDDSPRRRATAWLGIVLLTGSQLLLNFPQVVVMSVQLEVAYWLALGLATGRLVRSLPWLAAAGIAGVGLGLVQLVPSWEYLQVTARPNASIEFRSSYSLAPANLVQLVSPLFFRQRFFREPGAHGNTHELGIYDGAVAVALALWLLLRFRRLGRRRWHVFWLVCVGVLGLDLALGSHGLLYALQVRLPGIGLFRAPCRNVLILHFALAGLAALALDDLRAAAQAGGRAPWRRLWPLALPVLAASLFALAATSLPEPRPAGWAAQLASPARIWLGPALAVAAAALVAAAARGRTWALPLLVVFAALDQGVYGISYAHRLTPVSWEELRRPPPGLPAPDPLYRVHGGATDFARELPNIYALWGYRLVNGYTGAAARTHLDYRTRSALRVAGVRFVRPGDRAGYDLAPLLGALPRLRLVSQAVPSDTPRTATARVDVATTAVVDAPLELDEGRPGSVSLVEDRPGRVVVETRSPGRQLLILAERRMKGWRAALDGEPAPLYGVYGDFMGVAVGPGAHRVRFEFAPESLRWSEAMSAATLAGVLVAYAVLLLRARARGAQGFA
jgi:hypothetical protein